MYHTYVCVYLPIDCMALATNRVFFRVHKPLLPHPVPQWAINVRLDFELINMNHNYVHDSWKISYSCWMGVVW